MVLRVHKPHGRINQLSRGYFHHCISLRAASSLNLHGLVDKKLDNQSIHLERFTETAHSGRVAREKPAIIMPFSTVLTLLLIHPRSSTPRTNAMFFFTIYAVVR